MIAFDQLEWSVKIAILFSGIFLWVGMLTGLWKYYQIAHSELARSHYYVDIAHRSSLLYAPATLIIAVLAYFSDWPAQINLVCVVINLFFFSFSILSYVVHGMLKDTINQFKKPHQLGVFQLKTWLVSSAMIALVIGELGATLLLILGVMKSFI